MIRFKPSAPVSSFGFIFSTADAALTSALTSAALESAALTSAALVSASTWTFFFLPPPTDELVDELTDEGRSFFTEGRSFFTEGRSFFTVGAFDIVLSSSIMCVPSSESSFSFSFSFSFTIGLTETPSSALAVVAIATAIGSSTCSGPFSITRSYSSDISSFSTSDNLGAKLSSCFSDTTSCFLGLTLGLTLGVGVASASSRIFTSSRSFKSS